MTDLDRAKAELLECIGYRGSRDPKVRILQVIGESDWACEVLRLGGTLPAQFFGLAGTVDAPTWRPR